MSEIMLHMVRLFVNERLSVASEEIFRIFEKTITEQHAEVSRLNKEVDYHRKLLDTVLKPEIKLYRTDHQRPSGDVAEEAVPPTNVVPPTEAVLPVPQLCEPERGPASVKVEPEPRQIKEEPEERETSPREEHEEPERPEPDFRESSSTQPCEQTQHHEEQTQPSHLTRSVESMEGDVLPPKKTTQTMEGDVPPHTQTRQTVKEPDARDRVQRREMRRIRRASWRVAAVKADRPLVPPEKTTRRDGGEREETTRRDGGEREETTRRDGGEREETTRRDGGEREETTRRDGGEREEETTRRDGGEREETTRRDGGEREERQSGLKVEKSLESRPKKTTSGDERERACLKIQKILERQPVGKKQCSCCVLSNPTSHSLSHAFPFSCKMCGRCFHSNGSLMRHVQLHSKASKCGLVVRREPSLVRREPFTEGSEGRTHASAGLSAHLRTHIREEKPYCCHVCGKDFHTCGNLNKHMIMHTGDKPYSCQVCGKRVSSSTNLTKHMKIHNQDEHH